MWKPNKPNLRLMISPSIPQCLLSWCRLNFIISKTVLICYTGGAKKKGIFDWNPHCGASASWVWGALKVNGFTRRRVGSGNTHGKLREYSIYHCYFIASCFQKCIKRYDFLKKNSVVVSSPFALQKASIHLWWKYQPWYVELKLELIESESSRCSIEC